MTFFQALKETLRETFSGGSSRRPPRQISAAAYMVSVTSLSQRRAGPGKTPTAAQIAKSEKTVKKHLAKKGATVVGGEAHVDGFFDWLKDKASKEKAEIAKRKKLPEGHPVLAAYAKSAYKEQAAGDFDDSGGFFDWLKDKAAKEKIESAKRKKLPEGHPVLAAYAKSAYKEQAAGDVFGEDFGCDKTDNMGQIWKKIKRALSPSVKYMPYALPFVPAAIATPFAIKAYKASRGAAAERAKAVKAAKAKREAAASEPQPEIPPLVPETAAPDAAAPNLDQLPVPMTATPGTVAPVSATPESVFTPDSATPASSSMGWGLRRRSRIGNEPKIPHDRYRAVVWKRAKTLSGGAEPDTKALFIAQKTVDAALKRKGLKVGLPGARPGRVTR